MVVATYNANKGLKQAPRDIIEFKWYYTLR